MNAVVLVIALTVIASTALAGVMGAASAATGAGVAAGPRSSAVAAAPGDTPALLLTLDQADGTGPWSADDAPGNDSGPENGIVRTNDTVSYDLGIRYEGALHAGVSITFELPQGQELVQLPPYCKAGSSATPAKLPDPEIPATATSWQSLPTQTVVCVLDGQDAGTSLNYTFVTSIRPEVPQGTELAPVTFEVTSDQVAEASTINSPDPLIVSAAARFDVSKQFGGAIHGTLRCPWDNSKSCNQESYPLTIDAGEGGKGSSPLTSPIVIEDDLSPASFYGADVWARMVTEQGSEAAAIDAYAPRLLGCDWPISGGAAGNFPFTKAGVSTADYENSARDSGTITCSGELGGPVVLTLTDTDTSAMTVPTTTGAGRALPADLGLVVSRLLGVYFPSEVVAKFGVRDNSGNYSLSTRNVYDNITMTALEGTPVIDDPVNNTSDTIHRTRIGSGDIYKFFAGVPGAPGNTNSADFRAGYGIEGPPGSSQVRDGQTQVMAEEAVLSVVRTTGSGSAGVESQWTGVACDVWDPTRLALTGDPDWVAPDKTPSNGQPAWLMYGNTDPSQVSNVKIEYSIGAAGAGVASDCSNGTWVTDPSTLAAPTADAQGRTLWPGVNRVRVTYTATIASATGGGVNLHLLIGQVVRESEATTPIPNWASLMQARGSTTASGVFTDPNRRDSLSTYDPATHEGGLGDRLIPGEAVARVQKEVRHPLTGEFTSTAVPQYTSGDTIDYRLRPSLTAPIVQPGVTRRFTVEDCLPQYQLLQTSIQGGSALSPVVVQLGAPADAEITCPDNRQYVRWDLGEPEVGAPIEPIIVSVEILDVALNGVYTNNVMVAAEGDNSPADARTDDVQMQLVVPTGIKVAKTVDKPFIEVNPHSVTTPRTLTWSVFFANIDGPPNVGDVDVIDVLPDNSVAGNDFTGELLFNEATVAAGDNMTIHYTKTAHAEIALDPRDPSNDQVTGATVWCDASAGGSVTFGTGTGDQTADCPASAAEVTGIRITRPGPFRTDDQFQVDIAMTPVGNHSGDLYVNRTSAKAAGVTQSVGPARREAKVVASTVGNRVWEDTNKNGLQDDDEPGIPDWPVRLVGADLDGNPVDRSTVTDANGNYQFTELASGKYEVIFDPTHLDVNSTFTTRDVDNDSHQAKDSDADTATGATEVFDLRPNTVDNSWDAGVVVDRNVDIDVDKRLVTRTPLDEDNNTTVSYDVVVTNLGSARGHYDLDDEVKFGKGITITKATVANTEPGSITTAPDFDGAAQTRIVTDQVLDGGASHTYRVTVDATLATTVGTTDGDCELTTGETGTGFLNETTVAAGGTTSSDTACDPVPPRRAPEVSIDKELTYASPLDDDNRATVAYRITVTNGGDGAGRYDLRDELQYSGAVAVEEVKVDNTKPGDIPVNPGFDGESDQVVVTGQEIRPGESHQYVVTARVQVPTALTAEQADCKLTTKEQGTGYLNEARLEVNGTEVTDTACAPLPTSPAAGGHDGSGILPSTGGPVWWLALTGLLAVLLGLVLVARNQPLGRRIVSAVRPEDGGTA